jgi:hypothetical protein
MLLYAASAISQTRKDTVATIISRATAVYAQDTFSYSREEKKELEAFGQDLGKINGFIEGLETSSSGKLKTVGGNLRKWYKDGMNNGQYNRLVDSIAKSLTSGGDGQKAKDWRKANVPALFAAPVNAYLQGTAEPADDGPEPAALQAEPATNTSTNQPTEGNNMLAMIALIVAGLAFAGAIYTLYAINSRLKDADDSRQRHRSELDQLKADINQLKQNTATPTAAPAKPAAATEEILRKLDERIVRIEKLIRPAAKPAPAQKPNAEPVAATPIPAKPAEPETTVAFAKYPDLDNGFSATVMSAAQTGDKVYQIEIKGDKAAFMITNHAGAQKYALSDYRYYLEKGCDMLNDPRPDCRIDTKEYGQLTKVGSDWIIQKKAKIEFI